MKSVELKAFGKPHNVTVPDEPKSWSERHHYERDDWEPLEASDRRFIGLLLVLFGVGLLWVWWKYG